MKNGGKNKSVAFIINLVQCIYINCIYIYIYMNIVNLVSKSVFIY